MECGDRNSVPYPCDPAPIQADFRTRGGTIRGGIRKRYDCRTREQLPYVRPNLSSVWTGFRDAFAAAIVSEKPIAQSPSTATVDDPRGFGTRSETSYPFTASFNCFPALNFGRLDAGIWIGAPVRGFLPVRADRFATLNLPKPVRRTSSPRLRASVIALHTASTALAASPLLVPLVEVTAETNSLLFMSIASLERRNRNRANTNEDLSSSRQL